MNYSVFIVGLKNFFLWPLQNFKYFGKTFSKRVQHLTTNNVQKYLNTVNFYVLCDMRDMSSQRSRSFSCDIERTYSRKHIENLNTNQTSHANIPLQITAVLKKLRIAYEILKNTFFL